MATKDPIVLTEDAWTEIASAAACSVQILAGRAWIRHAAAAPPVAPASAYVEGREYDGHPIGMTREKLAAISYAGVDNTYARAMTKEGAIVMVTES